MNEDIEFVGCVEIDSDFSYEETATLLGDALDLEFEHDLTGRYEDTSEMVRCACFMGIELVLCEPNRPEESSSWQLVVRHHEPDIADATEIDISRHLTTLINSNSKLKASIWNSRQHNHRVEPTR